MNSLFRRAATFACALFVALGVGSIPATSAQAGCAKATKPVKSISKKTARSAIKCLFNKGRTSKNVKANPRLKKAAQGHSSVMASRGCFSHQCSGEPPLKERVARTGYLRGASGYELGEVILYAQDNVTSRQIVTRWMGSGSHRAIIKKSSFRHVGVGLSFRRGLVYATADFGHK